MKLITAMGNNRLIGVDNGLPWKLKDDLKFFREYTLNQNVLMGRKTFESLPGKLPNRNNIVLTRNSVNIIPDVDMVYSLPDVLKKYRDDIICIGGGEI